MVALVLGQPELYFVLAMLQCSLYIIFLLNDPLLEILTSKHLSLLPGSFPRMLEINWCPPSLPWQTPAKAHH